MALETPTAPRPPLICDLVAVDLLAAADSYWKAKLKVYSPADCILFARWALHASAFAYARQAGWLSDNDDPETPPTQIIPIIERVSLELPNAAPFGGRPLTIWYSRTVDRAVHWSITTAEFEQVIEPAIHFCEAVVDWFWANSPERLQGTGWAHLRPVREDS